MPYLEINPSNIRNCGSALTSLEKYLGRNISWLSNLSSDDKSNQKSSSKSLKMPGGVSVTGNAVKLLPNEYKSQSMSATTKADSSSDSTDGSSSSIRTTICVSIPAVAYEVLLLIENALELPLKILNKILAMIDKIIEFIKDVGDAAIDCVERNLRELASLLDFNINITVNELKHVLDSCPFLAEMLASMFTNCKDKSDPVKCLEDLIDNLNSTLNEPFVKVSSQISKAMAALRSEVSSIYSSILGTVSSAYEYLVQQYNDYIMNARIIPMPPFPGKKIGSPKIIAGVPFYTILEAIQIMRAWANCIGAMCGTVSATLENDLTAIMSKMRVDVNGLFNDPLNKISSSIDSYVNNTLYGSKVTSLSTASANAKSSIKSRITTLYDDNTVELARAREDDADWVNSHSYESIIPFSRFLEADVTKSAAYRAVQNTAKYASQYNSAKADASAAAYDKTLYKDAEYMKETNGKITSTYAAMKGYSAYAGAVG